MAPNNYRPTRVAIVGTGNVGATFAYALLLSGLAAEIVLIDVNKSKAEGEAMDLNHGVPLAHPTRIWSGEYSDCAGAAVTVITAGAAQKPGETRIDLVQRNIRIFKQIIPEVVRHNPEGLILVATNPVDILTYATWKLSGLPKERVLGSGTILDTARFRYMLSERFNVDPRSVHAYIIGEHGDSEVPVWSLANIAGMRLPDFCAENGMQCQVNDLEDLFCKTRDAAYEIIERKGATYYAVGNGLLRIVEAILRNQSTVLSISNYIDNYYGVNDVYLSLPAMVDHGGTKRVLRLKLNDEEVQGFQHSGQVMREIINQLEF